MRNRLRRVLAWTLIPVAIAAAAGAWLLVPGSPGPARFTHADCRTLELTDPRTGRPIVGVEDMALSRGGAVVVLSAHDRQDPAHPDGGIFGLDLAGLGSGSAPVTRLDLPRDNGMAVRPHGIALDPRTNMLAVINRTGRRAARIEVGPIGPDGWSPIFVVEEDRLCRANDLDFGSDGLRVTLDRADCEPTLRDLTPWSATGAVARLSPDGVQVDETGLRFANGISGDAVAETRGKAIRFAGGRHVAVPGGPDNLTRDAQGALVVAVHPGLLRLFLMRQGLFDRSGSRILRLAGPGPAEVLFDDPRGKQISGATVGLLVDGRLLIGSATAPGILVCEGGA